MTSESYRYQESDVVIVAAKRTAVGAFRGGLSTVRAHDLAATVIKDLLETAPSIKRDEVSEVIMGQVLSAGMNCLILCSPT